MSVISLNSLGNSFHNLGALDAKERFPTLDFDNLPLREGARLPLMLLYCNSSHKYSGASPFKHLKIINNSLYSILSGTRNQCNSFKCYDLDSFFLRPKVMAHALFCISWSWWITVELHPPT